MTKILGVFLGLFIDDELLAIGILGVVGASALLSHAIGIEPLVAGAVLICGNVLVLIAGVVRTVLHRVP
jgi:hypothetical protein